MSMLELTSEKIPKWFDRMSDWANPILVKEARQSLKSRQFVAAFILLLLASWLIAVFGMFVSGQSLQYGAVGGNFFRAFYTVLAVAIFFVVPFGAFRSLSSEVDQNTFEVLSITTLSPRQIVWGKLFSALLQVLIYYSAIAPFIAFCSLLQGFDLAFVVYIMFMSMIASMAVSMISLMLSTFARQRRWQQGLSLIVLGALFLCFWCAMAVVWNPTEFSLDSSAVWWATGFVLLAVASYSILFQQIATAQLTFESDNRSTGIRVTATGQLVLLWAAYLAYRWFSGVTIDPGVHYAVAFASVIHCAVFALFFASENNFLSRRIRRDLPANPALRLWLVPFMPGGDRGMIYLLLHLAVIWFLGIVWQPAAMGPSGTLADTLPVLIGYTVIYIGLGSAIARWAQSASSVVRPAHTRVVAVLLFLAGVIVPFIIAFLPEFLPSARDLIPVSNSFTMLHITNPFYAISELMTGRQSYVGPIQFSVLAGVLVVLLLNANAMARGVQYILAANVKTRRPQDVRVDERDLAAELASSG